MALNTLRLITNTLRLKPWIVDDNDADHIVIGADLISSAVPAENIHGNEEKHGGVVRGSGGTKNAICRKDERGGCQRKSSRNKGKGGRVLFAKVKRLFHPQSVDLWRHLRLLRFDKIRVSKAEKETPDSH